MAAYQIQTQFIVDLLKEKVTNVEGLSFSFGDQSGCIVRNEDFNVFFFLFSFVEFFQMILYPFFRIRAVIIFFDVLQITKFFVNLARVFSVTVDRANDVEAFSF